MIVHELAGMLGAAWMLAQKNDPAVLRAARSGNVDQVPGLSGHGAKAAD
jgi:hypothetical protein